MVKLTIKKQEKKLNYDELEIGNWYLRDGIEICYYDKTGFLIINECETVIYSCPQDYKTYKLLNKEDVEIIIR